MDRMVYGQRTITANPEKFGSASERHPYLGMAAVGSQRIST